MSLKHSKNPSSRSLGHGGVLNMQFLRATKGLLPVLRNCLLVACLIYIGGNWIMSSGTPDLDEVVLKHSLGNGSSIYGARDGQGGATMFK